LASANKTEISNFPSSNRVLCDSAGIVTLPQRNFDVIMWEVALVQCHRVGVIFTQSPRPQTAKQHLVTAELCMGDIVNLRIARKRAKVHAAQNEAAANRLAYGRSKNDRTATLSRRELARKCGELHRIETGDGQ
jgi:hypothetical protein